MAESYEPEKSEVGWVKAVRPQPINSDGLRFASPILRLYSCLRGNGEFLEVS